MTGPCEGERDEAREKDVHWDVPASTNNYQEDLTTIFLLHCAKSCFHFEGGRFLFGRLVA